MRDLAGRHRWGIRLAAVALVAMLALGSAVRPSSPASAAPSAPGAARAPVDEGIDQQLWAACKAFSDLLDFMVIDPRRPLDVSEWKLPHEVSANILKASLSNLKTAIAVAVGSTAFGRVTGAGMTIEEWFAQKIREWRPPSGAHAPDWYTREIRDFLECELTQKEVARACGPLPLTDSVEGAFIPDHCWGTYPASNYDIGYNRGDPLRRGLHTVWGTTANLLFSLAASAVQLGLWLMGWAFSLDMRKYDVFALQISDGLNRQFVGGPIDLVHVAWVVLIGWAGFAALRNRVAMAAGEVAVSILMVGISLVFMANNGRYLSLVWDLIDEGSHLVLAAGLDQPPCEDLTPVHPREDPCADYVRAALAPAQKEIQQVFIEQPYDYLNWGRLLTHEECRVARDEIVSIGPHGDDGWPRRHMERAAARAEAAAGRADGAEQSRLRAAADECRAAARFNENPSSSRWLGSILNLVAAGLVFAFLAMSSVALVLAKVTVGFLFAVSPFAAVAAILPGGGRRLAWQWLGTLIQAMLVVVATMLAVSMLVVAMHVILGSTSGIGLVERWIIVVVLLAVTLGGRRRIVAGTQSIAAGIADKLTHMTPAGAGVGPVGAGVNITAGERAAVGVAKAPFAAAGEGVRLGGRVFAQRMRERRSWHNIVKARAKGDRELDGVAEKTYYAEKPPTTSNGPGPRGGYDKGFAPRPGPSRTPPPPGTTPGPGGRPPHPAGPPSGGAPTPEAGSTRTLREVVVRVPHRPRSWNPVTNWIHDRQNDAIRRRGYQTALARGLVDPPPAVSPRWRPPPAGPAPRPAPPPGPRPAPPPAGPRPAPPAGPRPAPPPRRKPPSQSGGSGVRRPSGWTPKREDKEWDDPWHEPSGWDPSA
ncbi:MAG TPA: type IV secretion system protein [Acidimicrobiales bacterium]